MTDQMMTTATAARNTVAVPARLETRVADLRNISFMVMLNIAQRDHLCYMVRRRTAGIYLFAHRGATV